METHGDIESITVTTAETRERLLTTEEEIIRYLFEDVARLPIITNRSQELWLGIQLRAVENLDALVAPLAQYGEGSSISQDGKTGLRPLSLMVSEAFVDALSQLADGAAETYWSARINIADWANDLLVARRNIYDLKNSRLRKLLDHFKREPDSQQNAQLFERVCNAAELLAMLPGPPLKYLASTADYDALEPVMLLDLFPPGMDNAAYVAWLRQNANHARHELVTGYLRYAVRVARNEYTGQLDFPDLVQHGFLGLMKAAERFDYRLNARFGTYATNWVWQSIGRAQSEQGSLIRVPVHIRSKLEKLVRLVAQRDPGQGNPLADPELLAEAGFLDEEDYHLIRSAIASRRPIDEEALKRLNAALRRARRLVLQTWAMLPLGSDDAAQDVWGGEVTTAPLEDRLPIEQEKDGAAQREMVQRLLSILTEREQEVIALRFGLVDGRERTLEQIGKAFGLTRERIRQIEQKAMLKFERYFLREPRVAASARSLTREEIWNIPQLSLPPVYPAELLLSAAKSTSGHHFLWLDDLLTFLPHSSWHARSRGDGRSVSHMEQLAEALVTLGAPAHYTQIIEQANAISGTQTPLDEIVGYNILISGENLFILLGNGVFTLVEWEKARTQESEPLLPFCPLPLPDPPNFEDALFESVFVARNYLTNEPTADDLVAYLLRWAEIDAPARMWQRQGILFAYYLLDLIPYVCIAGDHNPRLRLTLPAGEIGDLRRHCLETLTRRLAEMPTFWWVLQQFGPARPVEFAQRIAAYRSDDPDDVLHRLYILSGLGATARLPNGRYQLTSFGEICAAVWAQSPEVESFAELAPEPDDLSAWSLW